MLFWGFIFLVLGFLTCLILFLCNLDMFSRIRELGFGAYLEHFFANMNTAKVVFIIAAVAFVLGVVLYFVARGKKKGEKEPIIPASITKFFKDIKREFKNIVWPTFPAVARNTGVTLAVCALTAIVIVAVDIGLGQLINLLLNL